VSGIVSFTEGGLTVAVVSAAELVVVSESSDSLDEEDPAPKRFFSFPDARVKHKKVDNVISRTSDRITLDIAEDDRILKRGKARV